MTISADGGPTVSERPVEGECPNCGESGRLWRVEKGTGAYESVETLRGPQLLEATIEYRECRDCGGRFSR